MENLETNVMFGTMKIHLPSTAIPEVEGDAKSGVGNYRARTAAVSPTHLTTGAEFKVSFT